MPAREARAAGAIGHPNICEVYDLGILDDGSPYLVMEKLVGQTVSVTGRLSDGRNTIGTSGEPRAANQSEPRTDKSQAATDQHHSEKVREAAGPIGNRSMNNGTYPELKVSKVTGTGQKCVTGQVEGKH